MNQTYWQHDATSVSRHFATVHRNLAIIDCVTASAGGRNKLKWRCKVPVERRVVTSS